MCTQSNRASRGEEWSKCVLFNLGSLAVKALSIPPPDIPIDIGPNISSCDKMHVRVGQ